MSANSAIEWTDATWNPIRARNLQTGKLGWHCEHATTLPLRWKKPRKIFVCSMTDLFADFVLDDWIDRVFAVMVLCPQHTFQVLTKRADRMRDYALSPDFRRRLIAALRVLRDQHDVIERQSRRRRVMTREGIIGANAWAASENLEHEIPGSTSILPLPNVWLGVSCERQDEADARIPLLLQTPAAVRFISAEPLLGPINLEHITEGAGFGSCLEPAEIHGIDLSREAGSKVGCCVRMTPALDWVIVGGESGSQARPMHPQWARNLRDQCHAAGVPFFFKQWGEFASVSEVEGPGTHFSFPNCATVWRVGKKAAGRLLDGAEHNGFPETRQSEGVSHAR